MAVLTLQPMPAEPWRNLSLCWSPTGLDLSTSRKTLEQPPPVAAWVAALHSKPTNGTRRDDTPTIERMESCSTASCVPLNPCTPQVSVSASPGPQQRATSVVAGRKSDEDKNRRRVPRRFTPSQRRTGLEQTCPPNTEFVYEYIAVVISAGNGYYADWPDIKTNGGWKETMEELKQNLKEKLLGYFEEVVRGNCPIPPARFKTLDDYEEVGGEPMPEEDRESFHCLLPCRITLEETKAWMARKRVVSRTLFM